MSTWFEAWSGWAWQQPWAALLLPALPAGWWWCARVRPAAVSLAPASLLEVAPLPRTAATRLLWLPAALEVAALVLLVLALMAPARRVEEPAVRHGIDIMLCLDVSSSMAATDLDADHDRLAVARSAAAAFVAGRPHDRIGIVRFARFPDLVCPPTLDHAVVEQLLRDLALVARDGPEDATGIGTAVARAVEVLSRAESPSRVVVLVTDGEENVAAAGMPDEIGPLQAAQLAQRHAVRVHCLVVRGAGANAAVDTAQVEELARRTDGRFFAVDDAAGIGDVYRAIDALEATDFAAPQFRLEDRAGGPVLAAMLAMLLSIALRRTWLEVVA